MGDFATDATGSSTSYGLRIASGELSAGTSVLARALRRATAAPILRGGRRRSSSGGVLSAEAQPRRVLTWSRHRTALEEESAAATASSGVWGALLGADGGARAALRGDCASVGSSSASDLCLREEYVSEKHLSLLRVRSAQSVFTHVYLADASARGTHVNGDLVHHATRQLRSGDLLELRSADASAAVTLTILDQR